MVLSFQGLTPYEFVESMKKRGIRVPGIGHRLEEFIFASFCITEEYITNQFNGLVNVVFLFPNQI